MTAVLRQLTARDDCRPGSYEWDIHNVTAWRLFISAMGGLLTDLTPPPADFGLGYLNERAAA